MSTGTQSQESVQDILVVGDWFVDEYWFVVRHHSEISSHIKPYHYRIFTDAKHIVRDLCGGGFITRVLYELREYNVENLSNTINNIEADKKLVIKDKEKIKELKENNKNWNKNYCNLQAMSLLNEMIEHRGLTTLKITTPEDPPEDPSKRPEKKKQYELFGLGRWNPIDNNILEHFIHARCQTGRTVAQASFSLNIDISCKRTVDVRLDNLESKEPKESTYGTTRCIRVYRYVSGRFKQLHRIDWEQVPSLNQTEQDEEEAVGKFFAEKLPQASQSTAVGNTNKINKLAAVIIDDHTKGVITENLITIIKDKANSTNKDGPTKWFVRTKDSRIRQTDRTKWPSWLEKIDPIELLVVGPEISCRCYPINGLLTEKDRLAEHAYELIYSLIGTKGPDKRRIKNLVLTSDKLEVVVLLGDLCFVARPADKITRPEDIENIDLVKINWTTAFFAALVYEMLNTPADSSNDEKKYKEMIDRAIKNAHEHSGVRIPQVLKLPTDESCQDVSSGATSRSRKSPRTEIKKVCKWPEMQKDWSDAKSIDKLGIIKEKKRLEIWRPSTDLPGFIVCIKEKRAAIRRIWQKMNSFILREDPPQSLSILLEADPAVGKSFLVEKLAEVSGCTLVQCDITQMIERKELLDLFDRVANAQAQSSGPVFVFVDEINATLGSSPVYGAFLSPLESGKYMRNGQYIQLKPCIWMFAGTPDGDSCAEKSDKQQKEKRKDFESRMTMIERIDYESMRKRQIGERNETDLEHEAKLEQVYLGAKRINDAFNDVIQIDLDILKAFYGLKPKDAPARRIKRLATSLENVQYGRVHKGNCTSLEWQEVINDIIPSGEHPKWREEFEISKVEYVHIDLS